MSNIKPFFSINSNTNLLKDFSSSIKRYQSESNDSAIANCLGQMVDLMARNASLFDQLCTCNIDWIGDYFLRQARDFPEMNFSDKSREIITAFTSAYRFICELEFNIPGGERSEITSINRVVDSVIDSLPDNERQNINFARFSMPLSIIKKVINDPLFTEFRDLSKSIDLARQTKSNWDEELDKRKLHVDSLRAELKDATSSYNFVALVNGFQHLIAKKIQERKIAFVSLIVLAIMMVFPPFFQIIYVFLHIDSIGQKKDILIYTLPTILAIEVILLFFFRIVLAQFRSVKAQVLQLDLRIALCQFIEDYAEYSAKITKNNISALTKFETIVFSNLVSDGESIPTTFDGLDHLANLIKSVKK